MTQYNEGTITVFDDAEDTDFPRVVHSSQDYFDEEDEDDWDDDYDDDD